jgi:ribokinase
VIVAGSINMDLVAAVSRLPRPGETVRGTTLDLHPGGKGANQAVAAARAGASVVMVGCLGDDAYAGDLEGFLASNRVDISAVRRDPSVRSGIAMVLVDANGENTIVSVPGANARLSPDAVTACPPATGDVLIAQFETPLDTTKAFFIAAHMVGAVTVLNAAPAAGAASDLLVLTDILVVNESELAMCAGRPIEEGTDDRVAAARELQERGARAVVVTLGSRGVIAFHGTAVHELPAHAVTAVDTTGAGDCFVGSLAARLVAGDPLAAALRYANAAASLCVQRPGAGPSMPLASEVLAVLAG